jgi:hypothetical protein
MKGVLEGGPRQGTAHLEPDDKALLLNEVNTLGAESLLEFGPGTSTAFFLTTPLKRIVTCEYLDEWLEVAREQFKDESRVTVLPFTDEFPVEVEGLGPDDKFDIAFVDAPKGFNPMRKIHQGFADTSRLNTCLFALKRAPVVLLHDAKRPLERGTLGRLWVHGYKFEFLDSRMGMARITRKDGEQNRPNP